MLGRGDLGEGKHLSKLGHVLMSTLTRSPGGRGPKKKKKNQKTKKGSLCTSLQLKQKKGNRGEPETQSQILGKHGGHKAQQGGLPVPVKNQQSWKKKKRWLGGKNSTWGQGYIRGRCVKKKKTSQKNIGV